MDNNKIKQIVKEGYSNIAKSEEGCCSCSCKAKKEFDEEIAKQIGYSDEEINLVPEANLGLGCGNPLALGKIKPGETVLDLGSGAGFDCFIASRKVGIKGKVIDESLPIETNSIDVVISNCVINLSPDKLQVFKEAFRVLKKNGRMYLSDIVLLGELTKEQKNNPSLLVGCVSGALPKEEYLSLVKKAGFKVQILAEDKEISKKQYNGIPLESLKIEALKL